MALSSFYLASKRLGCVSVAAALVAGCAASPQAAASRASASPADAAGAGGVITETATCPPSNPFCADPPPLLTAGPAPISNTSTTCSELPIDLTPAGVNIMVAVDGSSSMQRHWPRIQAAIRSLRQNHPDASFGVHLFWGQVQMDFASAVAASNPCGEVNNNVLDVGANTDQQLVDFLGDGPPGPGIFDGLYQLSAVVEPINYYLTHATKLADPTRTNYLVLITDGNDNCFGAVFTSKSDKLLAYQKLAVELSKANIRIIPIGFDAASVPDSNGMFGATPAHSDLDVLGTLLEYGGSGLSEVPKVDDPAKLATVISQVGQSVRSCRFDIPSALDPAAGLNPFELSFSINGKLVPRDRHSLNGWNFANGSTSRVELYGQGCEAVQSGLPLKASKSCSQDICGTAAVKVETKPRAVLLLLDSSASRIECADGTDSCLSPPDQGMRSLAFWEVVEHAVGVSLTAPINDDIEFGLQFFPAKNAEVLSCDVAAKPEIPPAPAAQITIMKQMFQKAPFGLSPVVQVIENVAAAPGRLSEPDVLGAVVLLSDGGDNCTGNDGAQNVTRLGAAAKTLLAAGVKTYAVRYGSEQGRTVQGEMELTAIVTNGGTAVVDPAMPSQKPYLDARNETELSQALEAIADRLATCSFTLSGLPGESDKDNANLFLNGEAIPFDKTMTKQDGWNWLDPQRTSVELYGDSCTAFKTNRRTSVVVEFGCPPVELL